MLLGRPLLVAAAMLLLAYAVAPLLPAWSTTWVGIAIVLVFVVLLPGYAIARLSGQRTDDPLDAATYICTNGLIFVLMVAFLWALTGVSIDAYRAALPVLVFALALMVPARDNTRVDALRRSMRTRDRRLLVVLGLLMLQAPIGVAIVGPPMEITSDTFDHAGYVAEIARTGDPFPTTAIYLDPGPDGADIRKALLHAFYGFIVRHTGASPIDTFSACGAFLLAVMTLVVYTTSRALLRRHRLAAAIAVVLFLVATDWGVGGSLVRAAFYPNRFGAAFLLLFVMSAMEVLNRGPVSAMRWCIVYAFAATATHVQYGILVMFASGMLMIWKPCSPIRAWGEHMIRTLRILIAAAIGVAPFMLFRYFTAYRTNPLHEQVQGVTYVTDTWFMADPGVVWRVIGPVGLAAILCIPPLWSRRRDVPGIGYGIAALVTYLCVELVPFFLTPLYSVIKYVAFRLDALLPIYLLPAALFAIRPPGARLAKSAVWVAAIIAALPLVSHTAFSPAILNAERQRSPDRWARGLFQLAQALPPGSVIASDPVTSYLVSAFTPYHVVCTLDQHAPPNDLRVEERMTAARDIVSPYTSARDKERLIRENEVTHVVVNEAIPPGLILNYWTLEPAAAAGTEDTFRSLRYEFEPIPLSDGLTAFRWRSEERLSTLPRPVPKPVVAAVPAHARVVDKPAGEAQLAGASIHGAGIIPSGGELVVDLYWTRLGITPPGTYVVTVRFDKKDVTLPFDGKPFPKVTRKLVETVKRERYRFRDDHMILGGLFGPDAWAEGEVVEDAVRVRIPNDLAPGRYTVQAKMRRVANQPNHWLGDYLYDHDSYTGVDIGDITVQRW